DVHGGARAVRALLIVLAWATTAAAGPFDRPALTLAKPKQAEIFVHALHGKDAKVRRIALDRLSTLADQQAVRDAAPAIAAIALDGKQALDVRQEALLTLIAMPSADAIDSLWPLMKAIQKDRLTGLAAVALAKHVAAGSKQVSADKLAAYLLVWIKVPDDFT